MHVGEVRVSLLLLHLSMPTPNSVGPLMRGQAVTYAVYVPKLVKPIGSGTVGDVRIAVRLVSQPTAASTRMLDHSLDTEVLRLTKSDPA